MSMHRSSHSYHTTEAMTDWGDHLRSSGHVWLEGGVLISSVIGAKVYSHDMLQLILGTRALGGTVGQHHGCTAHAEQGIGYEHAPVIPPVPAIPCTCRLKLLHGPLPPRQLLQGTDLPWEP